MCGRFSLAVSAENLQQAFAGFSFPTQYAPRPNIAPGQPVLALCNDDSGQARFLQWGLIPSWSKDPLMGRKLINARAETLSEKPSFRGAYRYRRCLLPADAFFEWRRLENGKKQAVRFSLIHSPVFALAGLWESWQSGDGSEAQTCTIITTEPNALVAQVHNRMPVILPPEAWQTWLSPQPLAPSGLQGLLSSFPANEMQLDDSI